MTTKPNILFIDDEANILSSIRRMLRKQATKWNLDFANSGQEGIDMATTQDFHVVVTDMRMPEMDGLETLRKLQEVSPDTVRIMLTGNADQKTAIDAINQGEIFRFFTKPCNLKTLNAGLESAIRQHNLMTAEKELLEQTLAGSIRVLMEACNMAGQRPNNEAKLVRKWAKLVAQELELQPAWPLDMAANLFDIARFAVPQDLQHKMEKGKALSGGEQAIVERISEDSHNLIKNIPRLENVAQIVLLHNRGFNGSGYPLNGPQGTDLPQEARILKILRDSAHLHAQGLTVGEAFQSLMNAPEPYDPELLGHITTCITNAALSEKPESTQVFPLSIDLLEPGMLIASDIVGDNASLLLAAGEHITAMQIAMLKNWVECRSFNGKVDVVLSTERINEILDAA